MKVRIVFDYIYYFAYGFVGKPKSQDAPHEMTCILYSLTILVHGVILFISIENVMGLKIPLGYGKLLVTSMAFVFIAFMYYYFILKKNGERILVEYAGRINERFRFVVGCLIFIEALLFPLIYGMLMRG